MTLTTIAFALALVVFLIARRMRGEAVPVPKKLFLLPVLVAVIGLQNLTHVKMNTIDIGVIAAGCALSLAFGLWRGRLDRVSMVDGVLHMAWSLGSVAVFVVGLLSKLALDAGGVAAGGTSTALGSSIFLSLGVTLLGEAVVVWQRVDSLTSESAAGGRYRGVVQQPDRPTIWPPIR
jgi:hypothetical protein